MEQSIIHGDLSIEWQSMAVKCGERVIPLTATEFRLLAVLYERRGWVISHNDLVRLVWGENAAGYRGNLKLYIWYLRRKIEDDPSHPKFIITRSGIGYMLAATDPEPPGDPQTRNST